MGVDKRAYSKYTIIGSNFSIGFYPYPRFYTAGAESCRAPRRFHLKS
jgi:hypothetical protein